MARDRLLRVFWWVMVALSLGGALFAGPMKAELENPFFVVPVASSAFVGAVLSRRRPENPVGWVFLGVGALAGVLLVAVVLNSWGTSSPGAVPWWGVAAAWVAGWAWYPLLYLMTIPTLLLFPSGLLSPRWRIALWLPVAALLCATAMAATAPFIVVEYGDSGDILREVTNPLSPGFMAGSDAPEDSSFFQFLMLFFVAGLIAAILSTGIRIKRAQGVERLQMRWFGFSVAMFVPLIGIEARFGDSGMLWMLVLEAMVVAAVPVSCGIAILRYRLYEIDRIISRTVTYAAVIVMIVVVYLVVVGSLSLVLPETGAPAVAAATLAAAALFRPLLSRVKVAVDRRFNRSRYDARIAADEFAQRLRQGSDTDEVEADLVSSVTRALEPSRVAVWIRQP